jgi:hypothetical protein
LSASVPSRHILSSAAFTTNIAESNFRYTGYDVSSIAQLTLESSTAQGNGFGLIVGGVGTTARILNSVFTGNTCGICTNGIVLTRQNNMVSGNHTDIEGILTPLGASKAGVG